MKIRIWDLPTRLFHWLLVMAVIGSFVSVKLGGNAMIWHGRFGYIVLALIFFRPFYGDYWVIDLAEDYSWVLVGEPAGKYFWILARQKQLDPKLEEALLVKAEKLGYQRKDLIKPSNKL